MDQEVQGPQMLDALPTPILYLDEEGRIRGCNTAASILFGCAERGLVGASEDSLLANGHRPPLDPTAPPTRTDYRLQDGQTYRVQARCVGLPRRGASHGLDPREHEELAGAVYLRILEDVAERERIEAELRRETARLAQFVDRAPAAIAMVDRDMRYLAVSRRWIEDYNLAPDVIGKTHYEVFPEIPERWKQAHSRCLEGATEHKDADVFERADGRLEWVRWEIRPWYEDDGDIGGLILHTEVITEQKLAEQAVRQAQKMESLGVLAGGVAHDFNNLLVAMMGQLTLARSRLSRESPALEHLRKVERAAERAADLTRQMLAYSGRGATHVEPVDINEMIRENLHLFEAALPKTIELRADMHDDLPRVAADPGQLQQVLMNLILNGADAISGSGRVTVSTGVRDVEPNDGHLWLQTGRPLDPGRYVILQVEDTGTGMARDTMARIFDPFFTTKASGRGLGLAAVLGIVRGHAGGLAVYSEVGRGSSFKVLLPALGEFDEIKVDEPEDSLIKGAGMVLVIDDEEPVREAVMELLEDEGFAVVAAADGPAGLRLYREWRASIGLVILDLSLPVASGDAIFRELSAMDPGVKVLLTSGYSAAEATKEFGPEDLWGFIQKPYQPSALVRLVKRALRESSGAAGQMRDGGESSARDVDFPE